jgi:aspartate aminotransferase
MRFAKDLLEKVGVAVVPGIGFGAEGYFRFSFASDISLIRDGIRRIEKFIRYSGDTFPLDEGSPMVSF